LDSELDARYPPRQSFPSNKMSYVPDKKHQVNSNVLVGVIIGTKGISGEIKIQPHTDNPDRFIPGSKLLLSNKLVEVEYSRREKANYIVKLKHIDTLEQARGLQGDRLEVFLDDLVSTAKDVYYYYHILDMDVWTTDDDYVGKISEIISTGSNDVYVVSGNSGDTLVPALSDVVVQVDIAAGKMLVHLQDWF